MKHVKIAANGKAYLNIGCGLLFHTDWNNLDLFKHPDVQYWDIRRGLPYPDCSMDAVYSSHTLEHVSYREGIALMREAARVLKPGGIMRFVVPDLERICQEYLKNLEAVRRDPSVHNQKRYEWIRVELFDQMVRTKRGGEMLEMLESGRADLAYVKERDGDQFKAYYNSHSPAVIPAQRLPLIEFLRKLKHRLSGESNPLKSGELHKWMYDGFSLSVLMQGAGIAEIKVMDYRTSNIDDWQKYNLDRSTDGEYARKPDSVYVEGVKPAL